MNKLLTQLLLDKSVRNSQTLRMLALTVGASAIPWDEAVD